MNRSAVHSAGLFLLLVSAGFFFAAPLRARIGIQASYSAVWDNNAFRNYENLSDLIQEPSLEIRYSHRGDRQDWHLFYSGSLYEFQDFTDRRFQVHEGGAEFRRAVREDGSVSFRAGLSGLFRSNEDPYAYYDYRQASAFGAWVYKPDIHEQYLFRVDARYQDYLELPAFSYFIGGGEIRMSRFWASKTTLIVTLSGSVKAFTEKVIDEAVITEQIETSGQGQGEGRGKGRGQGNGATDDPDDSGQTVTVERTVQLESPRASISQWAAVVRAAQSLGQSTGLALEGGLHRNPSGGGRILTGQDGGYEMQDDLFDDPYSYESERGMAEITRLLPLKIRLKAGGEIQKKHYDRSVYDEEGEIIEVGREDSRRLWWVSLNKSFNWRRGLRRLNLQVQYFWIDNQSNDPYYDGSGSMTRLGCTFSF